VKDKKGWVSMSASLRKGFSAADASAFSKKGCARADITYGEVLILEPRMTGD
jgi:hypothetical protein